MLKQTPPKVEYKLILTFFQGDIFYITLEITGYEVVLYRSVLKQVSMIGIVGRKMKREALLILGAVICLGACGSDNGKQVAKISLPPQTQKSITELTEDITEIDTETEEVTEEVSKETQTVAQDDELPADTYAAALEKALRSSFGNRCSVYVIDDTIYANVWKAGLTTEMIADSLSSDNTPEQWVSLRKSAVLAAGSLMEEMESAGVKDTHLSFNIASESDPRVALLMTKDREITYDFLETDESGPHMLPAEKD